jgi:hypothetical protein
MKFLYIVRRKASGKFFEFVVEVLAKMIILYIYIYVYIYTHIHVHKKGMARVHLSKEKWGGVKCV